MEYSKIIEISRRLHVDGLKKLTKSELIEFIIKSNMVSPDDSRFTCHIITDGVRNYRALKGNHILKNRMHKYMLLDEVYDFGTNQEAYRTLGHPSYLLINDRFIKELREPENYNDYLKKYGL